METRASYLIVGSFVLALTVALAGFVVWLARVELDTSVAQYDIRFSGAVSGLQVGSSVSFRGIPAGEVVAVSIEPDDIERVLVTIEVPRTIPVVEGTFATLQLQGITGAVTVLLSGGSQGAPPLVAAVDGENPEIPSRPSQLAQLLESTPELVADLSSLVNRAAALMSPQNQAALTATLENLAVVTGGLADRMGDVQTILNDAAGTVGNVRDASAAIADASIALTDSLDTLTAEAESAFVALSDAATQVEGLVAENRGDLSALITEARSATENVAVMAREIRGLAENNSEPLLEFTTGTLVELTTFLAEARALIAGLNRVATEVERDPAGFLFGNQQQGYEVPE